MNKNIPHNIGPLITLLGIVFSAVGIYFQYQNMRPCVHPISYGIGAVDARFEVSNAELVKDAKAAAAIWNTAAGKPVLSYDPNAKLKISLIYDDREVTAKLGAEIARKKAAADTARVALEAAHAAYVAEQTAYNDTVTAINARGGATPEEATVLEEKKKSLQSLADSINARVTAYNESTRALNAVTAEYNKTAGHLFEAGKYVRDAAGTRIEIFEFIGANELERVLAHELGHAIGLDHNPNPDSIMYAETESGNLVPTQADLSALGALCGA